MHTLLHHALIALLRRLLAAGGIAMVLALGLFSNSAALHKLLHAHDHAQVADHADNCAVMLFAQGISTPVDTAVLIAPASIAREIILFSTTELMLIPARYLRQPERGPPAC